MPVKLIDAQERVLKTVLEQAPGADPEAVRLAVKLTVEAIGFHVAANGEIADPRPEERFMPRGMEPKWGGGSRRRRSNDRGR